MKERPILFSGPMVRAILEGTKTQTRRVVKPQIEDEWWPVGGLRFMREASGGKRDTKVLLCPHGQTGDQLWLRETWRVAKYWDKHSPSRLPPVARKPIDYRENPVEGRIWAAGRWRPSIHMPRWASRITLQITGVRVERLQSITTMDARAEGISEYGHEFRGESWFLSDDHYRNRRSQENFAALWDSINAKRGHGWETNPWVWVIKFERAIP